MTAYFLRRLLLIIPTFIGVTILVFTITRFAPGGPIEQMMVQLQMGGHGGSDAGRTLSPEQIQDLEVYYGFDKPILQAYGEWLLKVVKLDLGTSTRFNEPVWDVIKVRLPVSLYFGFWSLILTYCICIPLGIFKAIKHKSLFDTISSVFVFVGYAIPSYIIGIGLMYFFGSYLEWFPLGGFTGDNFDDLGFFGQLFDLIWHTTLPLAAYVAGSFAIMTLLMKNSMMDNLSADYIRTAMAKGLPFHRAVIKHALRNSLIPICTSLGMALTTAFTGSLLIEKIFNIDGIGLLAYESLLTRDYPIVMGDLVLMSLLFMFSNILADITVAIADPRIQFK